MRDGAWDHVVRTRSRQRVAAADTKLRTQCLFRAFRALPVSIRPLWDSFGRPSAHWNSGLASASDIDPWRLQVAMTLAWTA